jgi:hypothetical protein
MFEASRLKIRRAGHHIRDLKSALESYCKSNFCRVGVEADAGNGGSIVRMERTRELPAEVPLMLCDAVNNLRTALDYLACDIVRSGGRQPTRYTRFLLDVSKEKLVAALDTSAMKAARPDLVEAIVETIKPYKGGDDMLYGLHDLDIDSRHRLIVPDIAVVALHNVSVRDAEKKTVRIAKLDLGARGEFQLAGALAQAEIANYQDASFQALFDKTAAFAGQPIIPTMLQLSLLVAGIVDTIQQAAESSKKETGV